MLRSFGSKVLPRLTPNLVSSTSLLEVQCGLHSSAAQCGVGVPERSTREPSRGELQWVYGHLETKFLALLMIF